MKKLGYIILLPLAISSCQIEDPDSPTPDEGFIKYFGDVSNYSPADIEFTADSTSAIIFGTQTADDGRVDLSFLRVGVDGSFNQEDATSIAFEIPAQEDINGDDVVDEEDVLQGDATAGQIEVIESGPFAGNFIFVGSVSVTEQSLQIQDVSTAILGVMNTDLDTLVTLPIPNGTPREGLDSFGNDIIQTADGNFVIGLTFEVLRGGATDLDFRLMKIGVDLNGPGVLWMETEILSLAGQDETVNSVFEKENGNLVIIGTTSDESALGESGGNNGTNVTYVELSSEGDVLNNQTYGIGRVNASFTFNDVVNGAIQTAAGFAITGTSTLTNSTEDSFAFFMSLNQDGAHFKSDTILSAINPNFDTEGYGIVQARDNNFVVFGEYKSFVQGENSRAGEALFMKVNQSGEFISEAHYGSNAGFDSAIDGLLLSDDKILVLANTDFGAGLELVTLIKANDTGEIID